MESKSKLGSRQEQCVDGRESIKVSNLDDVTDATSSSRVVRGRSRKAKTGKLQPGAPRQSTCPRPPKSLITSRLLPSRLVVPRKNTVAKSICTFRHALVSRPHTVSIQSMANPSSQQTIPLHLLRRSHACESCTSPRPSTLPGQKHHHRHRHLCSRRRHLYVIQSQSTLPPSL